MSAWKNILTDPPTPGTGIRATDGKSVFVGHIMQNVPWFTGVSMDDGSEITISTDHLTEWMPTTAPEREETADEMFRELGYHLCFGTNGVTSYVNSDGLVEIYIREGMVAKETCFGDPIDSTEDEILACAKWIEERRANDAQ